MQASVARNRGRTCKFEADGRQIDALFITHEHVDHIKGAGILSRRFDIPIFATADTWAAMEEGLGRIAPSNKRIVYADEVCAVNDLCVKPFRIPHDAAEPVGYNVFSGEKKNHTGNRYRACDGYDSGKHRGQ